MKNMLIFTALILSSALAAQNYGHQKPTRTFGKNQTDIQLGYGLIALSPLLDGADTKVPPLTLQASRFLGKNFSLGVSYTRSVHQAKPIVINDGLVQRITNSTHQAALRAAFHVTKLDNWDIYGGVKLAVNCQHFSVDYGDFSYLSEHMRIVPRSTKASYTAIVGSRFAFAKKWSIFGELGFGQSLLTLGMGYRV